MNLKNKFDESVSILCDDLDFVLHEEYRMLRTNVKFSISDDKPYHCIGVTSSVKGEAKTTTAINLAYVLAENGEKVCIVEADMRLPTLKKRLNLGNHIGLSEYLTGQASGNDILEKVMFKKCSFYCVPGGTLPPNPAELLASPRFEKLLETLGKIFTYIIVDMPPVTLVSDACIAGSKLDGTIVVVSQKCSTKGLVDETMKRLQFAKIKVIGFVRTFTKGRMGKYGKYRKYGKYGKYRKYSADNDA